MVFRDADRAMLEKVNNVSLGTITKSNTWWGSLAPVNDFSPLFLLEKMGPWRSDVNDLSEILSGILLA